MNPVNYHFTHFKTESDTEDPERKDNVLAELDKIKLFFPEEYTRLTELYRQGDLETVLQIIHHRKAVDQLKNLSPLL